jgi:hypothetical protein
MVDKAGDFAGLLVNEVDDMFFGGKVLFALLIDELIG